MATGYVVSQSERICMPTPTYDDYSDTFDEWIDITQVCQPWRVFYNLNTGKEIDCNKHYENMQK